MLSERLYIISEVFHRSYHSDWVTRNGNIQCSWDKFHIGIFDQGQGCSSLTVTIEP